MSCAPRPAKPSGPWTRKKTSRSHRPGVDGVEPQFDAAHARPRAQTDFQIQELLDRLEAGAYGICEECGEEIGIARLKARPVTTLCIQCKSDQEVEERKAKRVV